MDTIGIIGAGTMGNGIAYVAASHGHAVVMYDVQLALAQRGFEAIRVILQRHVARQRIDQAEVQATLDRVQLTTDLGDMARAALVIEAVPEDLALKRDIFHTLDHICDPRAPLCSNPWCLPVVPKVVAAMQESVASQGPAGAITVCKELAPQLMKEKRDQTGWAIRRVSLKTRNPERSTPDLWEVRQLADQLTTAVNNRSVACDSSGKQRAKRPMPRLDSGSRTRAAASAADPMATSATMTCARRTAAASRGTSWPSRDTGPTFLGSTTAAPEPACSTVA